VKTIRVPPLMNLDGYAAVLREVKRHASRGEDRFVLDFSSCQRAYPDGMLPLIASLGPLRWTDHVEIEWLPPKNEDLAGLFEGVGWSHHLTTPSPHFIPPPRVTRSFTPATCFTNRGELDAVRSSIMQVVLTQSRMSSFVPEATEWALWEVMENVLNHSDAQLGWVQASTFSKSRHINIVVADCGLGLAASLTQRYGVLSDRDAIKQAVEKGGTRDPDRNAGYGLTGCVQIARSNRGDFKVWSGEYLLDLDVGRSEKVEPIFGYTRQGTPHQGTIVELEIRTDRPVDLASALGQKRPVTLMELQHDSGEEFIFDIATEAEDLGTRLSGADVRRKILNLAQAEPNDRIVLDFSAVHMLSSSFADELIAKMANELGKETFFRRFELRGLNQSVDSIVQATLWDRLK
jgi:hypothetical protein